tara:strand:- start:1220 stop:1423 length:204 start_codon:yes stop_codon:yes gene_type:complete
MDDLTRKIDLAKMSQDYNSRKEMMKRHDVLIANALETYEHNVKYAKTLQDELSASAAYGSDKTDLAS